MQISMVAFMEIMQDAKLTYPQVIEVVALLQDLHVGKAEVTVNRWPESIRDIVRNASVARQRAPSVKRLVEAKKPEIRQPVGMRRRVVLHPSLTSYHDVMRDGVVMFRRRYLKDDRNISDDDLLKLLDSHLMPYEIAEKTGYSRNSVHRWRQEMRAKMRQAGNGAEEPPEPVEQVQAASAPEANGSDQERVEAYGNVLKGRVIGFVAKVGIAGAHSVSNKLGISRMAVEHVIHELLADETIEKAGLSERGDPLYRLTERFKLTKIIRDAPRPHPDAK